MDPDLRDLDAALERVQAALDCLEGARSVTTTELFVLARVQPPQRRGVLEAGEAVEEKVEEKHVQDEGQDGATRVLDVAELQHLLHVNKEAACTYLFGDLELSRRLSLFLTERFLAEEGQGRAIVSLPAWAAELDAALEGAALDGATASLDALALDVHLHLRPSWTVLVAAPANMRPLLSTLAKDQASGLPFYYERLTGGVQLKTNVGRKHASHTHWAEVECISFSLPTNMRQIPSRQGAGPGAMRVYFSDRGCFLAQGFGVEFKPGRLCKAGLLTLRVFPDYIELRAGLRATLFVDRSCLQGLEPDFGEPRSAGLKRADCTLFLDGGRLVAADVAVE
jgi:hypothetical protein